MYNNKDYVSKLTSFLLEGRTLNESMSLMEARIDALAIDTYTHGAAFKGLEKNAMTMLKKVEDADDYRKEREKDPKQSFLDELEDLTYVASIIRGTVLENFPASVTRAVDTIYRTADRGITRAENIFKTIKDPKEILTRFKPLEYTQRALASLTEFFKILNIPWDYDYKWQNYLFSADPGNIASQSAKDAEGNRKVDYSVPEGISSTVAFLVLSAKMDELSNIENISESLSLSNEELDTLQNLWADISHEDRS